MSFLRRQESSSNMREYYVYILASKKNGTIYIGLTCNLLKRVDQHKKGRIPGFTSKYAVNNLVYYERYSNIYDAIAREKRLKKWKRNWKIKLIEKTNPGWQDLFYSLVV